MTLKTQIEELFCGDMEQQHVFFGVMKLLHIGLDYNDVNLRSGKSGKLVPGAVTLETRFSRNISLLTPLASAAMDTVTEHKMAIELAMRGGIGVIHRNLSPEEQAAEVAKVKFYLNGRIDEPKCIRDRNLTMEHVEKWRKEKGYRFHSFPVLDENGQIAGLLTSSDFKFCDNPLRTVRELMTPWPDLVTASEKTTKEEALGIMRRNKKSVLPLVAQGRKLGGLFVFSDIVRIQEGHASHNTDAADQLRVAAAVGIGAASVLRAELLAAHHVDAFVIDTAHAWTDAVLETVRELKRRFPETDVVVGNVTEPDAVEDLVRAGADGIKVGQGSGSICTTTVVTGVGRTQLTAVYECARVARQQGVPVCADGGIKHQDDIVKALAAGAESVMMGNLLAGHDEAPGDIFEVGGAKYMIYRGMGSEGAIKQNLDRYHQGGKASDGVVLAEGVEGRVPYKGSVARTIPLLLAGVRSGMSAIGAATLAELRTKAKFERRTQTGAEKAHPHGITF